MWKMLFLLVVVFYLAALVGCAALSADSNQAGKSTHQHMMPMEPKHETHMKPTP